jgi:hypothetical protein
MSLSPKYPAEVVTVTFDFTALTTTAANATIVPTISGGSDAAPSGILNGFPTIVGAKVYQKIQGGNVGTIYKLTCSIDGDSGNHYQLSDTIQVQSI